MSRTTYAVAMDCPRATVPDVLWRICVPSELDADISRPYLWVPRLETWTPDTLRMVLYELAAYLPPDDNAEVTVNAKMERLRGRPRRDGSQRVPRFHPHVEFQIAARGWTVSVRTDRNEQLTDGVADRLWDTGEWTEPMQAILLDLAAKSPFRLAVIRPVDCSDPRVAGVRFASRRDVIRGVEPSREVGAGEQESRKQRIKRLITELLDGGAE